MQSYGLKRLFLRSTFPISGLNLKMKAEFFFAILVSTFKSTRCNDLKNYGHEHLKYYIIIICTFPLLT